MNLGPFIESKYFQPLKQVRFHVIIIRIKYLKGSYYPHLLNNYLFIYLNFSGLTTSLLSSACGCIAIDSNNVPINFDSWPKVPKSYKDDCFNILKVHVEYNVFNFAILEFGFSPNAFI